MGESHMCEHCGQLQHFRFCNEARIALFDGIQRQRDELHLALRGMMIFYGMDEDRTNGACSVTWDTAREAMGDRNHLVAKDSQSE